MLIGRPFGLFKKDEFRQFYDAYLLGVVQ